LIGPAFLFASLQPFLFWVLCFTPFGFQWLFEDYQRWKWKWLFNE
jgi:hypothetical protein